MATEEGLRWDDGAKQLSTERCQASLKTLAWSAILADQYREVGL